MLELVASISLRLMNLVKARFFVLERHGRADNQRSSRIGNGPTQRGSRCLSKTPRTGKNQDKDGQETLLAFHNKFLLEMTV